MTAICDALKKKKMCRAPKIPTEQTYVTVFGMQLLVKGKFQFIDGYVDIFVNLWKVNCNNWNFK
jgi:hypothetical protein